MGSSPPAGDSSPRYDSVTIVLHWLTAALVAALWSIGKTIDYFPRGTPRVAARSTHILLGVSLAIVLLIRLSWRATSGTRLPRAMPGFMGRLAEAGHYVLYGLVAATLLLGITNVWVRGDTFFGWFTVPKLAAGNKELKVAVEDLHAWSANTTLVVAGVHALFAMAHYYTARADVLRRMLLRRSG